MEISRIYGWLAMVAFVFTLPLKASETEVTVSVNDEAASINGTEIFLALPVYKLTNKLGQPDRTLNLHNDIRIWDDLGIRAYSKPGSTSVDSFGFTMRAQDSKIHAKKAFSGQIKVPKGIITARTTAKDLKKLGFTRDKTLAKFYRLRFFTGSFLAEIDQKDGGLVAISLDFGF